MEAVETSIMLIIILLGTLILGIVLIVEGAKEKEYFLIGIGIFTIALIIVPSIFEICDINNTKQCTKTTMRVKVTVVEKEHVSGYTSWIGKTPIHHTEKWNVTLNDGETVKRIDDKAIYEALEKNDKIFMNKNIYKKKNGEVYKTELEFEKKIK